MPGSSVFSCLEDIPWPPSHTGNIKPWLLELTVVLSGVGVELRWVDLSSAESS